MSQVLNYPFKVAASDKNDEIKKGHLLF